MNLAVPAALWGLLVLPLIVLLYMLRTRRQDTPVSSLLLWQRARKDLAARRPVRRFERSLLLLLQLLAASLLIVALARPRVHLPGTAEMRTVIIMDVSASMQARDVRPSRFSDAVAGAYAAVDDAPGEVMVIAAAASPRIAAPFGDAPSARRVLAALRPTDGPSHLDQAVTLALGQRAAAGVRVEVFTDRAGQSVPGVTYHVVGTSGANLGIAAVAAEQAPSGSVVIVQIQNASSTPERVPVVLKQGTRRLAARVVAVGGGAVTSVALPVSVSGTVEVALEREDVLSVDNVAHVIAGTRPARVVVAGAPDRVLTEALEAIPVRVIPAQRITPEALRAADVVILNRTPPVELPPGNYLLLGTTARNLPLTAPGRIRGSSVLRWAVRHPVMRYVTLDDVTIGDALRLAPRGGEILAEGETPLLWAYEGDGIRAIVSAFSLDQSDLPLHMAFPIFLQNALTWLGGGERVYEAGVPVVLPARGDTEAVLEWPDGSRQRLASSAGRFVIPAADRAGVYVLRTGTREYSFVVNPSAEEIAIAPVRPRTAAATPASGIARGMSDIWRALVLFAVVVLSVEWWLWLRGLPARHGRRRGAYLLRPERPS
ncbi:MAG TPA: VWA domain-containing protein [bacterium]